ncbi:hypothetical protein TIFTF001_050104 [Ficus carica]|uniref:Uncharacterized protein n=1 Tax=Ficus carica TaxID=3494 RepID=A0AA87YZW0_FICCA|nr:hypothetical protein TIFTF001_050104 [Ficus carica]
MQFKFCTQDYRGRRQCSVSFRSFKIQISQHAAEEFVHDSWGDQVSRGGPKADQGSEYVEDRASNLAWSRLVGPKTSCRFAVGREVRRRVVEEKTAMVLRWWSFRASS